MKGFRKLIFWTHLTVGVVAGVVIFIMCATGTLLAFEDSISTWLDGYHVDPEPSGGQRLSLDILLEKAAALESKNAPSSILIRSSPQLPVAVTFGKEETFFLDPYSGASLGEGAKKARGLFRALTDWHRWLGSSEANRANGRAITGGCNLGFLFLVLSGIWLWWPRKVNWTSFKAILLFNSQARGKARDWNWHNVFGFWCCLPLFVIVLTGVIMSYTWANNLLFRLTGNEPPPVRGENSLAGKAASSATAGRTLKNSALTKVRGLEAAFSQIDHTFQSWKTIRVRLIRGGSAATFSVDQGDGRPDQRVQVTFDLKTGEAMSPETFASYNWGRKLRTLARFAHTGQAGGMIGQVMACLATASGTILVWTGLSMAFKRFCGRFLRQKKFSEEPAQLSPSI